MSKHLGTIKTLSYQASLMSKDDNQKIIAQLFKSIQSHPDVINHPKQYLGTLFLLLESLLNNDIIQQQIQNKINELTNNRSLKPQNQGFISKLPTDVLAEVSPFLTRKENIRMRHVSKLFNVEFSNKYLIIKSHWNEDKFFEINQYILNHIIFGQPNSLQYEFPNAIIVNVGVLHKCHKNWFKNDQNIQCWNSLFSYVNQIRITQYNIHMLPYIPINIVFNASHGLSIDIELNLEMNCESTCSSHNGVHVTRMSVSHIPNKKSSLKTFQTNYESYFANQCNNDFHKIRKIDILKISHCWQSHKIISLLTTLTKNFGHLSLYQCQMCVGTIEELNAIFHPHLETLQLRNGSQILCDKNILIINDQNNDVQYGNIQTLFINVGSYSMTSLQKTLSNLTHLRTMSKVQTLHIKLTNLSLNSKPTCFIYGKGFLYRLLHTKYTDIYLPQLKNIYIKVIITDTHDLDDLIKQINELGSIVNHIHDNINSIQFMLHVINNIPKSIHDTTEISTNTTYQYLNEQGITQIGDWLKMQQWLGIPKQKIKITFKGQPSKNNNDTQTTESIPTTDDFYIASLEYYASCFHIVQSDCWRDTQKLYKTMLNDRKRINIARMTFNFIFQTAPWAKASYVQFYREKWQKKDIDYLIDNLAQVVKANAQEISMNQQMKNCVQSINALCEKNVMKSDCNKMLTHSRIFV